MMRKRTLTLLTTALLLALLSIVSITSNTAYAASVNSASHPTHSTSATRSASVNPSVGLASCFFDPDAYYIEFVDGSHACYKGTGVTWIAGVTYIFNGSSQARNFTFLIYAAFLFLGQDYTLPNPDILISVT